MLHARCAPAVVGDTVTGAIVVAAHQLQQRMDSELRVLGLSSRAFVALCTIRDNPGLSRAALARELGIAPQAVGAMAARLVAAGLAKSSPLDPGNPTYYQLTQAGLDSLERARDRVAELERQVTARLCDTTLERIAADLTRLREVLDEGAPPHEGPA
jgi:DNA-binding MarR family transcriptional regulator